METHHDDCRGQEDVLPLLCAFHSAQGRQADTFPFLPPMVLICRKMFPLALMWETAAKPALVLQWVVLCSVNLLLFLFLFGLLEVLFYVLI